MEEPRERVDPEEFVAFVRAIKEDRESRTRDKLRLLVVWSLVGFIASSLLLIVLAGTGILALEEKTVDWLACLIPGELVGLFGIIVSSVFARSGG